MNRLSINLFPSAISFNTFLNFSLYIELSLYDGICKNIKIAWQTLPRCGSEKTLTFLYWSENRFALQFSTSVLRELLLWNFSSPVDCWYQPPVVFHYLILIVSIIWNKRAYLPKKVNSNSIEASFGELNPLRLK